MVSLIDIVPQKRTVQIAAGDLELRGLGLRQIADLFLQFPSLRNLVVEGSPEISSAELIIQAPDAIGTIIAEAAGWDPSEADNIITGGLTPEELIDCLTAIRDLTFPRGITPFLEKLATLLAEIVGGPVVPPGKDPATIAPSALNSSSPQGIPAET